MFSVMGNVFGGFSSKADSDTTLEIGDIEKPEWKSGDYWNYTFDFNHTEREHEYGEDWMHFKGFMNRSVIGTTTIEIEGTEQEVYEVEHQRIYTDVKGGNHLDEFGWNVSMEMSGWSSGTEFIDVETLELLKADFYTSLNGTSTVIEPGIQINVSREGPSEMENTVEGDFYSFPIEPDGEWGTVSEHWVEEETYQNYSGFQYPEDEHFTENYNVTHDYYTISGQGMVKKETPIGPFEAVKISARDNYTVNGSEEETGRLKRYYSPFVGNLVHENMSDIYHDTFGMNVSYGDVWLQEYHYENAPRPEYGFSARAEEKEKSIFQGETAVYELEVENRGKQKDEILCEIEESENDWSSLSTDKLTLESGERDSLEMEVEASSDISEGTYIDKVNFTSNTTGDSQILTLQTEVKEKEYDFNVNIEGNKEAYLGEEKVYNFTVENTGDREDTIEASIVEDQNDWSALSKTEFELDVGEKGSGNLTVSIASDTDLDNYVTKVEFASLGNSSKIETREVNTMISSAEYDLKVKVDSGNRTGYVDSRISYKIMIANEGELEDTVKLEIMDDGSGWASLNRTRVSLPVNQTAEVLVYVDIPKEAEEGEYIDQVRVSSLNDETETYVLDLTTAVEGKAPIYRPSWESGDYWNYTYHLNATGEAIEEMYQVGTVNYSVEGVESIEVDGESVKTYNLSFRRVYRAIGKTERTVGTVEFDMEGLATGNEYYKKNTLDLVASDYTNNMEGPSEVMGLEIMINITDRVKTEKTEMGDFYSFPIQAPEEWESESVLDLYANSYTDFTPDSSENAAYPEDEEKTYNYDVIHDYEMDTQGEIDYETGGESFDALEIRGTDRWTWNKTDEVNEGHLTTHFSKKAGNTVHTSMDNLYHDHSGLNVTDATFKLDSYNYNYTAPKEYAFDAYAEGDSVRCKPEENVTYEFTVSNTGQRKDTIGWELNNRDGLKEVEGKEEVALGPGESKTIEITLTFASDIELNTTYDHTFEFFSHNNLDSKTKVTVHTWVTCNFLPSIRSKEPNLESLTKFSNEEITFKVETTDPEADDVTVKWYIDGEYHCEGKVLSKTFEPGEYEIKVRVSDEKNDGYVTESWSLTVEKYESPSYHQYIFLGIIIAAGVVGGVYYYIRRKKKKKKEELETLQKRE